jgi:hypothetical protein
MTESNDEHTTTNRINSAEPPTDEVRDNPLNEILSPEVIQSLKDTINKLETYNPHVPKKEAIDDRVVALQIRKLLQEADW